MALKIVGQHLRKQVIRRLILGDHSLEEKLAAEWWHCNMEETDLLLFPDMLSEQHAAEEFVYAAACQPHEWHRLFDVARQRQQRQEPQPPATDTPLLSHLMVAEEGEKICIILQGAADTREQATTTAAYIRMVGEFSGMIYVLPYNDAPVSNSLADIINRTAGVPPHQIRHIDIDITK